MLVSLKENVNPDVVQILVRRENILADALRAIKRKSFCVENEVSVSYIIILSY